MQFALTHSHPSPADTSALRDDLLALVHRLTSTYAAADPGTDAAALRALLATWGRVIVLQTTLDPRALAALDAHPRLARDVYDVIAEGLLNAVKHSDEKSAEVSLDVVATGAGSRLRARVRSRGARRRMPSCDRPPTRATSAHACAQTVATRCSRRCSPCRRPLLSCQPNIPKSRPHPVITSSSHPGHPARGSDETEST
jgi:hypothetical protein